MWDTKYRSVIHIHYLYGFLSSDDGEAVKYKLSKEQFRHLKFGEALFLKTSGNTEEFSSKIDFWLFFGIGCHIFSMKCRKTN